MSTPDSTSNRPHQGGKRVFSLAFLPLFVLVGTFAASLLLWQDATQRAAASARRGMEHRVVQSVNRLRDRFAACERVLDMGRVLFRCSESVSRDEWATFVESLDLDRTLPGVNGVAFVRAVPAEHLDDYLDAARSEIDPSFERRVRPGVDASAPLETHYVIQYHEPAWRNASVWGLDVATHAANRVAYDLSMTSGAMRMTRAFDLGQHDKDGDPQRGLVMAIPVYEGRSPPPPGLRRDRIKGWIALSVDAEWFLSDWWDRAGLDAGYVLTERDRSGRKLPLHQRSGPGGEKAGPEILAVPMTIGGRRWELDVFQTAPMAVDDTAADMTLILGLVISLLLSGITWSVMHTRHRAVQLAEKMTGHLRESEERQRRLAIEAGEANRMKSLFLANMSHDVRTPMTAILGYTRLLEQELGQHTSPLVGESMTAIRRGGDHLLGLINDVLDLSKIEAGRLEFEHEPIDTADLIAGCIGIVRQIADAKHIELHASLRSPIPARIAGDPTRIRQILLNLLGNAVKFTDLGRVSFVAWAAADARGTLCFEIRDTGIGMSHDDLRRVFDPFVQADASHTRTHGGTGLGLTIARHLVVQMGGEIEVDSATGVGSRFTVRLPVEPLGAETIADIAESRVEVQAPPDTSGSGGAGRSAGRVLVAEDGPDNQRLIAHILGRAGYEFDIVDNGREALKAIEDAAARSRPYAVVLLDMQLPEMDGYEVARALRGRGLSGPVIALTAHAMTGDREKCIAAGCDAYLSKPFSQDDLVAALRGASKPSKAA